MPLKMQRLTELNEQNYNFKYSVKYIDKVPYLFVEDIFYKKCMQARIYLTYSYNKNYYSYVRLEDCLSRLKILLYKTHSIKSSSQGRIYLHRLICSLNEKNFDYDEDGNVYEVHHQNLNSLDNRFSNLVVIPRKMHIELHKQLLLKENKPRVKTSSTRCKMQKCHYSTELENKVLYLYYVKTKSFRHIKKFLRVHYSTFKKIISNRFLNKNFNKWNSQNLIKKIKDKKSTKSLYWHRLKTNFKHYIYETKINVNNVKFCMYKYTHGIQTIINTS